MAEPEEKEKEQEPKKSGGPLCKNCYFPESEHRTGRDDKLHCKGGEFSTSFEPLAETQIVGPQYKPQEKPKN